MKFKLDKNMKLYVKMAGSFELVSVVAAFPKTKPKNYLSLLNEKGEEMGFIEDLSALEASESKILEKYLEFKHFQFQILGFYRVEDDFGVRNFEVKTRQGDRKFQTELDFWPKLKNGKIEFTDIFGDRFYFTSLEFGQEKVRDLIN